MLEEYFDFLGPLDIRIKGHRIGIDDVLTYHLEGCTPQQIADVLPTLTMEEIYACLTYYYRNQVAMDNYLRQLASYREQHYQAWVANPPPILGRLRTLYQQHQS